MGKHLPPNRIFSGAPAQDMGRVPTVMMMEGPLREKASEDMDEVKKRTHEYSGQEDEALPLAVTKKFHTGSAKVVSVVKKAYRKRLSIG